MDHDKSNTLTLWAWPTRWMCMAAVLVCATVFAAEANVDGNAPELDPAGEEMAIEPNQAQVDFSDDGCVIKFIAFQKESNIRDGLRLLAALCRKNIIPSAGVDGPLTISRLYNVTFEEALNAVLGYGFKFEQDGDFVRVYTADEYKKIKEDPERMVSKVITLYYITAEEASKLIRPVLSEAAQITTTTPAESEITSGGSTTSLSGGGGGDKVAINDMIVLFDYPENIEEAEAVIKQLDVRPQQVLIEAAIMAARLNEDMEFGVDWNLLSGVAVTGFPANIIGGQGTPIETVGFAANPASASFSGMSVGFSADNVQAIITALEEVTDTTLLANPKILAVNKQEGSVLIGKKIGYIDTSTQTQTSTSSSVAFLETGTRLVFRPYIASDGYIRMDIYPKDSDGSLKSNDIPDETTTELKTNVIVRDGETVVIGGLFRDVVTTSRKQVPLLGNLPLLGAAFRGTTDRVSREEVIILLTPHIIEDLAELNSDDRADDVRMKVDGAKHNLQAIDRARIAEDAYARAARYYLEGDVDSAVYNVKIALMMRPTYLEARRLQERIIAETDPEELKRIDSLVQQAIDQQEAAKWQRR
jgi:type II secretory pathway component GspD/PulD (secretin)